ncbi:MAG: T9SS type A sorting domain-containing protein [Flavobacteriales bacterium]|nr:T9SS type A sorting domain-containing protein [Flavobacteriales bacterium]NNK81281.1 T9SS type A sorting domain-containing protein [Flavobacteriales bacterium]
MKPLPTLMVKKLIGAFCLILILIINPDPLCAQPGPGEKEYCFCTTPELDSEGEPKTASGTAFGGVPSECAIWWRGVKYSHTPIAGETAEDIMNALRDAVEAANPDDVVGPVAVNPGPEDKGQAIFCVKGDKDGMRQVRSRETDKNMHKTTFSRVLNEDDPFLDGVTDALVSVEPLGGAVILEMRIITEGGDELYIPAVVFTEPGQTDLSLDLIMALTDAGFDAHLGEFDFDDDGVEEPAIFIGKGIHARLEGLGMGSLDPGISTTMVVGLDDDCAQFSTAPVDLTKSFAPVPFPDGVMDRVQVKWYKDSPQIRYSDEDAAACDIKFWPKRFLDVENQVPIGPPIENPDTVIIEDVKKTYPDGSPREIFKWPIKFRAEGANNTKRVDPAIRYQWQVRCACYCGQSYESPWSEIKIFNTPDFDTITGIHPDVRPYDWPIILEDDDSQLKSNSESNELSVYPNPSDGSNIQLQQGASDTQNGMTSIHILDMTGRIIQSEIVSTRSLFYGIELNLLKRLKTGMYVISINDGKLDERIKFLVE